jgi:uncharacterized membrane protein SpoIIM required for sporulation
VVEATTVKPTGGVFPMALVIARREIRDQMRDWRILVPILGLTLFFPLLMNFTAQQAVGFVQKYGASLVADRLIPFLLMVVGFFPISISLVIALESFAGERERLSLEPLLASPLTDGQLYFGKMLASLAPPLIAAFIGIAVYLAGLEWKIGWRPPLELLIQVILLTTAQATVMVSGAVVISSQTTSVRAANLLASFIIVPMSQLVIGESLIMFYGTYAVLWWIVLGLVLLSVVLGRVGLHLFNREQLLGREFDAINLRWIVGRFWESFRDGARTPLEWYRCLLLRTLPRLAPSMIFLGFSLAAAYGIGLGLAREFTLPPIMVNTSGLDQNLSEQFGRFGMMSGKGVVWVISNNVRALALASLMGMFSFGVLSVILLMAPSGIIGYFAGNVALAGEQPLRYLAALVLPHAILEIPATILAGAAMLQLGLAAVSLPKSSSLGESWLHAFAEWAKIGIGLVLPLILAAAVVEVYVTPRVALLLLTGP